MNKVLITGASGMLGKELSCFFPTAEMLHGKKSLDLTSETDVKSFFFDKYYDLIIHCAAITDLSLCEEQEEAAHFLHCGILDILNRKSNSLYYISTVPVWEADHENLNVYFTTKMLGEEATLKKKSNVVIRTNIYGKGGFCDWFMNEAAKENETVFGYSNVFFNPVHVKQLSKIISNIKERSQKSIVSIGSDCILSKYEFLSTMREQMNIDNIFLGKNEKIKQDLVLYEPDIVCPFQEGMDFLKDDYKNK